MYILVGEVELGLSKPGSRYSSLTLLWPITEQHTYNLSNYNTRDINIIYIIEEANCDTYVLLQFKNIYRKD